MVLYHSHSVVLWSDDLAGKHFIVTHHLLIVHEMWWGHHERKYVCILYNLLLLAKVGCGIRLLSIIGSVQLTFCSSWNIVWWDCGLVEANKATLTLCWGIVRCDVTNEQEKLKSDLLPVGHWMWSDASLTQDCNVTYFLLMMIMWWHTAVSKTAMSLTSC